ncbi:MAG: hypothetical protein FJZ58_05900, partial [Chlamydiae bacterium]|nr:hypothetical protein [Chlamydiota bacterium]
MDKQIPISITDFKKMREGNYLYVDKTLFIEEWWKEGSEVTLITRPRRFGKTIALSSVKYFFDHEEKSTRHLFEGTKIWAKEEMRLLQGTYPVIFLSFKDVKCTSWEEACQNIRDLLAEEIERVIAPCVSKLTDFLKDRYKQLTEKQIQPATLSSSIKWMTDMLYSCYEKNTIVLIDEYDTPITYAYLYGYYDRAIDFMRNLLSKALKDNKNLQKGLLTGVVRTAKDGILSGFNNPAICTMLDPFYTDKFGFTEEEVRALLQERGYAGKQEEAKSWYNGYTIAAEYASDPATSHFCTKMYNPWSVLQYIRGKASPKVYWVNTGSTELLEELIRKADKKVQEELTILLQGERLLNKDIDTNVILLDLKKKKIDPWSFLFFAGYITAKDHLFDGSRHLYSLAIPNKEILELYKGLLEDALAKEWISYELSSLHNALIAGDVAVFQELLHDFILTLCSCHDLPGSDLERSLHMFVLGLLASVSERYKVKSNLEAGYGRYDILMYPRSVNDPAILIEFKKGKAKQLQQLS